MKNFFLFVFIGLIFVVAAMLWFYKSNKPDNDHYVVINGKKLIEIDLSLKEDLPSNGGQTKFFVPVEYDPALVSSLFEFYFRYPSQTPYPESRKIVPQQDMVRVVVERADRKYMRSEHALDEVNSKNNFKSKPRFIERRNGMDIYQYDYGSKTSVIGTKMVYRDHAGYPVVIEDPGAWSVMYRVYRAYNDHIELDYQIHKGLGTDFKAVDQAVLEVVKNFQPKH